jgi:RNA polymerase sigma-70 factor, ECF subfamily
MNILQPTRIDPTEDIDPNDLVVSARAGCEESYAELARRFFPRLVQLISPRISGKNHMDAEDIAQEALARAFLKLADFDPQYRFSTWLYTIAIRLAMDHNRGTRRRLALLDTHRSLFELRENSQARVASQYDYRESADKIWLVARSVLSESQYTAMWLRFAEDLSVEEIARVMRKTKVGVRVLLHRARSKMLTAMNMEDSSQPNNAPGEAG